MWEKSGKRDQLPGMREKSGKRSQLHAMREKSVKGATSKEQISITCNEREICEGVPQVKNKYQ